MFSLREVEDKMKGSVSFFQQEIQAFRTGRAHPALVTNVPVEVYGANMRLADVASVSIPENRQLLISPFDSNNVSAIAKGLLAANLNLNPEIEGNLIRLKIPAPDANQRQELVKQLKRKAEDAKVAVRNVRRESLDKLKKSSETEDGIKSLEKKIQDLTDTYCKQIDELTKTKESEITTV